MKPTLSAALVYCPGADVDLRKKRGRQRLIRAIGWVLLVVLSVVPLRAATPQTGLPADIGFSSLPGPTGEPYLGSVEAEFVITPTLGDWKQSLIYGNPGSSIFAGPINDPQPAGLQVTESLAPFSFLSLDYSSNNGPSAYDIQGFLGQTVQFHQTGTLAASFSPFRFNTLFSEYSSKLVDGLLIQVMPGPGVTSINLDNLYLVTIPEPGSLTFLFLACLVLARCCGLAPASRPPVPTRR